MLSCAKGNTDIIKLLLRYKASINIRNNIHGMTALMQCCYIGMNANINIKLLLQHGADVNI